MARLIYVPAAAAAPPPPPQVTVGGGRTLLSVANAATTTFSAAAGSGFPPATGDVLVRMFYEPNGTSTLPISVTIGTTTVTQRLSVNGGNALESGVWIGTARALPTGSALDVVITSTGSTGNPIGRLVVRVVDIHDWGGLVGVVTTPTITQGTSATQVSVTGTATSATSLLTGLAGVVNANCTPLTVAGWTLGNESTVGTTAGSSSDAIFVDRGSPGASTAATLTAVSATSWTQWAAAFIELL